MLRSCHNHHLTRVGARSRFDERADRLLRNARSLNVRTLGLAASAADIAALSFQVEMLLQLRNLGGGP